MQTDPRLASIVPVVFGGDVGAYTLGLECFEAFGAPSICVANSPVALISRSRIFSVRHVGPRATDEERLEVLRQIVRDTPGRPRVLLANNDGLIAFFARNREVLQDDFAIPYPDASIVELLKSKEGFAALAASVDALTPPSVVVDIAGSDEPEWTPPSISFRYPLVAKADDTDEYEAVQFEGKKKVWYLDTPEQLDQLWRDLAGAGFRGKFLVQEVIPGDDTHKRTVTMYVDRRGEVTLRAAGQVLLEDPTPTMIGNPSAMISRSMPELWDPAQRILEACGYRGFANFDLKVDPRDGKAYFFELNPRAGRSSYFVMAGGVNPMLTMARDVFLKQKVEREDADRWALYTLLPVSLIRMYVTEPGLRREIRELVRRGRVVNPLRARIESDPKRRAVVWLQEMNFFKKFKQHYRVLG